MPKRVPIACLLLVVLPLLLAPAAHAEDEAPDLTTAEGVKAALGDREASVRLAAARAALEMQDKKLTSPLLKLLKDDEVPIREAAMKSLLAREDKKERKSVAKGIVLLLKPLPREPQTQDLAREKLLVPALHDLAQPLSIKKLLDLHTMAPVEFVKARLRAVANVPSAEAIEALIAFGSRGRRSSGSRGQAAQALQYATGQKIGNDPDKWRDWWRENEKDFDFESAFASRRDKEDAKAKAEERKEEKRRRREEKEGRKGRGKPEEDKED